MKNGQKTTLSMTFTFDAAHRLIHFPADHKCFRLHGHSYKVIVALSGVVGGLRMILIDYYEIQRIYEAAVHSKIDHRFLNEIPGLEVSTTEVIAQWILDALRNYEDVVREDSTKLRCTSLHGLGIEVSVQEGFSNDTTATVRG